MQAQRAVQNSELWVRRKKIRGQNPECRGAVPAPKDADKSNRGGITPLLQMLLQRITLQVVHRTLPENLLQTEFCL